VEVAAKFRDARRVVGGAFVHRTVGRNVAFNFSGTGASYKSHDLASLLGFKCFCARLTENELTKLKNAY
jgi:hypothetical protein